MLIDAALETLAVVRRDDDGGVVEPAAGLQVSHKLTESAICSGDVFVVA
jgi:hypothetical protein